MTPPNEDESSVKESLIRLEAKIDVVLSRHEGKIDELVRRQGETTSTLREHDGRITANALTVAETRTAVESVKTEVAGLRTELQRRGSSVVSWTAVGVAALAVVIDPLLNTLLSKN